MSGTNGVAHSQSVTSRGPKIHHGYMVFLGLTMGQVTLSYDPRTGHSWWWQQEEAGVVERRFLKEHGAVALWNGLLGVRLRSRDQVARLLH